VTRPAVSNRTFAWLNPAIERENQAITARRIANNRQRNRCGAAYGEARQRCNDARHGRTTGANQPEVLPARWNRKDRTGASGGEASRQFARSRPNRTTGPDFDASIGRSGQLQERPGFGASILRRGNRRAAVHPQPRQHRVAASPRSFACAPWHRRRVGYAGGICLFSAILPPEVPLQRAL
jgi:hypothetical protein